MPAALKTTTLAVEDFQAGHRYWPVRPGFEWAWTVADVTRYTPDVEVFRNGRPVRPEMVRVTYRDGRTRELEAGEQVAIQGPWSTGDEVCPPLRPRRDCAACSHGLDDIIGYVVAYSRLAGHGVTFEDVAYVEGATRYARALELVHEARRKVTAGEVAATYAVIHPVYAGGHRTS
ncbi:hypothetical protein ACFVJK_30335 [Streptomyces sp. NPDC127172]|uniref:hypothetical protein n=1 Tax=Streptomyces sp. NPDC127172 TaxID=3345382 RepID=UPI0036414219